MVWIPSSEWLYQWQTKPRTSHPSRSVKTYTTRLNLERACDCKPVLDHVSTPTTSGVLRTGVGIQTGPDSFFSRPNDKEKKEVWQRETSSDCRLAEGPGFSVASACFVAHFCLTKYQTVNETMIVALQHSYCFMSLQYSSSCCDTPRLSKNVSSVNRAMRN